MCTLVIPLSPNGPPSKTSFKSEVNVPLQTLLNPYETELSTVVKEKLSQHLFESSIRLLIMTEDEDFRARESGLVSFFGQFSSEYQSVISKSITFLPGLSSLAFKKRLANFHNRQLSSNNAVISASELSDMYHFPNTDISIGEDIIKSRSRELPAPLSFKNDGMKFDAVLGINQYGGETSPIGVTLDQRRKHMYVIGKTGMGKTTLLTSCISQDMLKGKGIAVLDPHGDMTEELLSIIPENRRKDVRFFDPYDREFPMGRNILAPGIKFSNKGEGQEGWTRS